MADCVCCPAGSCFLRPAKLGRLRGVRFRLPGEGCSLYFCCPSGAEFRPPVKFGPPVRRTARRGRLWGFAPSSASLASPPKHPQEGLLTTAKWRGHASCAAGASLTRCARPGDLPPRRVMPQSAFALDESPLQPYFIAALRIKDFTKWEAPSLWVLCILSFTAFIKSWSWGRLP